jgi:transposase
LEDELVAFSNNLAENDQCTAKVQQKISGCFRSIDGAKIFCRIGGYLSTCCKHAVAATEALRLLFEGNPTSCLLIRNQQTDISSDGLDSYLKRRPRKEINHIFLFLVFLAKSNRFT